MQLRQNVWEQMLEVVGSTNGALLARKGQPFQFLGQDCKTHRQTQHIYHCWKSEIRAQIVSQFPH
jgi:hypothetical protein